MARIYSSPDVRFLDDMSRRHATFPKLHVSAVAVLSVGLAVTLVAAISIPGRAPFSTGRRAAKSAPLGVDAARARAEGAGCDRWFCDFNTALAIALWSATALETTILIWLAMRLYRHGLLPSRDAAEFGLADSAPELTLLAGLDCDRSWLPWALDASPLAVAIALPDGRIATCNSVLLEFADRSRASAIGTRSLDLWRYEDDREAARAAIERAGDRDWSSFRSRRLDTHGSTRCFNWCVRQARLDPGKLTPESAAEFERTVGETGEPEAAAGDRTHGVYVYLGLEVVRRCQHEAVSLQAEIVQQALMVPTFEKALRACLDCWCARLPWDYGEAWALDPQTQGASLSLSHAPRAAIGRSLAQFCRRANLDFGDDASGTSRISQAIARRRVEYIPDLDAVEATAFGHRDLALESGLGCCAIVPFELGRTPVVFLLFAERHRPEIARALPTIEAVMPYLERALQRQHAVAITLNNGHPPRIFENAVEGLFQLSPRGCYLNANQALAKIFGYRTPEELVEKLSNIREQFVTGSRYTKFDRQLHSSGRLERFTAEMYRRDGSTIWVEVVARAVFDKDGDILYSEGSAIDITERQRTEDKLRYSATHDELTGLWNRAWFIEQLQRILKRARRHDNHSFAVFFIDLDNFKLINDTLGHLVGDRLLVALSQRLNASLQQGQSLARLGGDEFTLSIDRIADENEALEIARRLCQQLEQPFQIDTHQLFAKASIGIVIGARQYETPEMVLKDADIAMYSAKARSKSGGGDTSHYVLFDEEMGRASQRRLRLEDDLRRAIEYGEMSLHYQPIVDLESMQTIGFEVLCRWQHPQYGTISPGEFIPLAEESGAIVKIGEWVLWEACQQLQNWKRSGLRHGVAMSVNVSSRQLTSGLIAQIDRALENFDIQPGELKVEITETVVMSDLNQARFILRQIEDRQIPILLDDFGTGYCSLNYLYELPIDTLKVDRSFVSTIDDRTDRRQVLDTIFQLAESLDLKVIAEGVENAEQVAYLERQKRCFGQGYLFSKPVPASLARTLLDRGWPDIAV